MVHKPTRGWFPKKGNYVYWLLMSVPTSPVRINWYPARFGSSFIEDRGLNETNPGGTEDINQDRTRRPTAFGPDELAACQTRATLVESQHGGDDPHH